MPRWLNIANLLTFSRLLLTPFIVMAILKHRNSEAFWLFGAAAWTDLLDGLAARKLHLTSTFGSMLDPIADKCLLSGVFLALAGAGMMPWWFVAIVFGRDLYILAAVGGFLLLSSHRKFPPSIWGKASTFLQIVAAVSWILRGVLEAPVVLSFSSAILWPSAALTVWSGLHYTWRGIQVMRAH
jgi:cardiolipin synthase (CMP-forming)